jgi:hypothetical protein
VSSTCKDIIDEKDTTILQLDLEISSLRKKNEKLQKKMALYGLHKKTMQTQTIQLIQKDKRLFLLKETIKSSFFNFNEEMIPQSYFKISKRFPHLNLEEIVKFERRVRENGGSIAVHGGDFLLTVRDNGAMNPSYYMGGNVDLKYNSWSCCHSVRHVGNGFIKRFYPDRKFYPTECPLPVLCSSHTGWNGTWNCDKCGAPNFRDSKPDNDCDNGTVFYLQDEDEKLDLKNIVVEDVAKAVSRRIEGLQQCIDNCASTIERIKNLSRSVELLIQ